MVAWDPAIFSSKPHKYIFQKEIRKYQGFVIQTLSCVPGSHIPGSSNEDTITGTIKQILRTKPLVIWVCFGNRGVTGSSLSMSNHKTWGGSLACNRSWHSSVASSVFSSWFGCVPAGLRFVNEQFYWHHQHQEVFKKSIELSLISDLLFWNRWKNWDFTVQRIVF